MKWILITSSTVLLIAGGVFAYEQFFGYEPRAAMAFINTYAEYDELMTAEEARVFVPGQGNNTDRMRLNELLNTILADEETVLSANDRLASANEGLKHLAVLKEEIDAAQASHAAVYATIDRVEKASNTLHSTQLRRQSDTVISLMRERQDITARITSLQSATNDHAEDILSRIAKEQGRLSDPLIIYINEGTPAAETRFDELNRLYAELSDARTRLETAHGQFVVLAL